MADPTIPEYCPEKVAALIDVTFNDAVTYNALPEKLDEQISKIDEKINTIQDCINPTIAEDLSKYLVGESAVYEIANHAFLKSDNYGATDSTTGNISDWNVVELTFNNADPDLSKHFYAASSNTLHITGNKTSSFPMGNIKGYNIGMVNADASGTINQDSVVPANIESVTYDSTTNITIVILNMGIVSSGNAILTACAWYNSPADAQVDQYIKDWNTGHDFIHSPMNANGTYGLKANKTVLENVKQMAVNTGAACTNAANTWTKYLPSINT